MRVQYPDHAVIPPSPPGISFICGINCAPPGIREIIVERNGPVVYSGLMAADKIADNERGYPTVAAPQIEQAVPAYELREFFVREKMPMRLGEDIGHGRSGPRGRRALRRRLCGLSEIGQRFAAKLPEGNTRITSDGVLQGIEKAVEGGGIMRYTAPELVAISLPSIRHEHIAQRVMIGDIVPKRAVAQLHPGIAFAAGPKGAVAVEEERQTAPALVADQRFLVNGIPLPEPVGYGQAVGKGLAPFSEEVIEEAGEAHPEIVVLLDVAVFMDSQQLLPGQATEIEAVLLGGQLEFAAEGRKAHIAVGDGGLVLQDDIDLPLRMADRRQRGPAQTMDNAGDLLRNGIQPCGEDDPGGIGIQLVPFQRRRIAAEHLREDACRQQQRCDENKQPWSGHAVSILQLAQITVFSHQIYEA